MSTDKILMDEKRKQRRKETAEVFTPFSLLDKMTKSLPDEIWNNPKKTFLDNSCGNGQIILYIINKKLNSGSTYIQALSTTFGVDIMEDNVIECKQRIIDLLKEKNIKFNKKKVNEILNYNIVCSDAFKWDYENWCPIKEYKAEPLF